MTFSVRVTLFGRIELSLGIDLGLHVNNVVAYCTIVVETNVSVQSSSVLTEDVAPAKCLHYDIMDTCQTSLRDNSQHITKRFVCCFIPVYVKLILVAT